MRKFDLGESSEKSETRDWNRECMQMEYDSWETIKDSGEIREETLVILYLMKDYASDKMQW